MACDDETEEGTLAKRVERIRGLVLGAGLATVDDDAADRTVAVAQVLWRRRRIYEGRSAYIEVGGQ